MLTIGITGGIGSGKSFICKIIEHLGYPVFYADNESKKIVSSNKKLIAKLETITGKTLWTNNTLDKNALAESIFSSDQMRSKVNSFVHPYVHEAFREFTLKQKTNLVFEEAAIILENANKAKLDKIVLVTAPLDLRIARIKKRDNATENQIMARISAQMSDEEKLKLSDYHIINDEKSPLLIQVEDLISELEKAYLISS